jgi:hypothetical protein
VAPDYGEYLPPVSLPMAVAIFSILVYLVAQIKVVRQITGIADRYFNATDRAEARIWPLRPFTATERRVAVVARLTPIEAPFEPERGAYGHAHGEGGGAG